MVDRIEPSQGNRELVYRLEVEGSLNPTWNPWLEAESIVPAGSTTVLHVRVADQAELYGRLRRIHDLNLRLISLCRTDGPDAQKAENAD